MLLKNHLDICDNTLTENLNPSEKDFENYNILINNTNFIKTKTSENVTLLKNLNVPFSFYDTEKTINSNHFLILKHLKNEDELNFWTYDVFETLMTNKMKQLSTKQGGKIVFQKFLKLQISECGVNENYLLFCVVFEKRIHLVNKNLFSFSHFDVSLKKSFHFNQYSFLKIKKNNLLLFLKEVEKYKN